MEVLVIAGLGMFGLAVVGLLLVRQRENGLRAQCMNNLRRIGEAMHTYADSKDTPFLPPARIADGYATWAVLIAPHLSAKHPLKDWDETQTYFAQPAEV